MGDIWTWTAIDDEAWLYPELLPLTEGRTTVFYDQRARGGSDAVVDDSRISFDLDVSDLGAIHTEFGAQQVTLLGWSHLGGVVGRYAIAHPDRIKGIILLGTNGSLLNHS